MRRIAIRSQFIQPPVRGLQSSTHSLDSRTKTPLLSSGGRLLPWQLRSRSQTNYRSPSRDSRAFGVTGVAASQAAGSHVWAALLSAVAVIFGLALSALAVAAIPAALEMRRTARAARQLMQTLEKELPDTAAAMRLTGLELSEAIQEVSLLSTDLTQGLQASARMIQQAESGMKQGARVIQSAATKTVLPAVRARVPAVKGIVEERLRSNSKLKHKGPSLLQMALVTKVTAKRIRFALAAADVLGKTRAVTRDLKRRAILQ